MNKRVKEQRNLPAGVHVLWEAFSLEQRAGAYASHYRNRQSFALFDHEPKEEELETLKLQLNIPRCVYIRTSRFYGMRADNGDWYRVYVTPMAGNLLHRGRMATSASSLCPKPAEQPLIDQGITGASRDERHPF